MSDGASRACTSYACARARLTLRNLLDLLTPCVVPRAVPVVAGCAHLIAARAHRVAARPPLPLLPTTAAELIPQAVLTAFLFS